VIYDVSHVTLYDYHGRVAASHCLLRLRPRDTARQRLLSHAVAVEPQPCETEDFTDFFGNAARALRIDQPHAVLSVKASSRVEVSPQQVPLSPGPAWEDVARSAAACDLSPLGPAHFLHPSRHAPLLGAASALASESFAPGRPLREAALALAVRIRAGFAYEPGATEVSTPLAAVLDARRGVCQDFAHAMIAGLRGLGVPAAYVSGYLRTVAPPGGRRLTGADATHAWVAVWGGPDVGWFGVDPTNGVEAGEGHVELAIGRDYADVAPLSGVVLASAGHSLSVAVDVVPVEREAQAG
jgi:transglutaminase-like putative cysteine protease